ncbi:MAG TPA: hypothetical protein VM099_06970, partial [Gemmatimonadaceae bacterium]|nr:hypothetical protein [Gemmatimonadaceae bacterium]
IAKEFVQDDLQPRPVANALTSLLDMGSDDRKRVLGGLAEVRGRLGEPGAALRVAKMASELVP